MAFEHRDILVAQYEELNSARAKALGNYESARLDEDAQGAMSAAATIVDCDARLQMLDKIAAGFVAQQQPPQGNRYGLSNDEVEIAHGTASADKSLTDDAREQIYAQNKMKLRQMRASGQYRDDQGRVTR